jgi:phage/plasmid-like protein (TIGR03299 family)
MAHEIDQSVNVNGAMFAVGKAPWHNLGILLPEAPKINEAIELAGLNWTVGMKPLFTPDKEQVQAMATYRQDTNKILGVVGASYKPLQNSEAFNFFQPFVDAKVASLETAGSLSDGKRVWVLAKLNADPSIITKEDIVEKYVLLSNSHDGSMAIRVGYTPIRVVCNNTLAMAHNGKSSQLLRVKHVGNPVETLENVREAMNTVDATFEATAAQYRILASKQISEKDLEKYVKIVFATRKQLEEAFSKDDLTSGARVMSDIKRLFETGRGNNLPTVRGTMWAAYNAISEYTQYERGENESKRLESLWFGTGATMNKEALKVAISMVA